MKLQCLVYENCEHFNYKVDNKTSNVLEHGFKIKTNFTQQLKKWHLSNQTSVSKSFNCSQESETELSTIRNRLSRGARDFKISHHLSVYCQK